MFLRDGVNEMMRNASCFVILFLVINLLHFPQEAGESIPLLVQPESLPNLSIKIAHFAYECTQKDKLNDAQK